MKLGLQQSEVTKHGFPSISSAISECMNLTMCEYSGHQQQNFEINTFLSKNLYIIKKVNLNSVFFLRNILVYETMSSTVERNITRFFKHKFCYL